MYKLLETNTGEERTSSVVNLERILEVVQDKNEEETQPEMINEESEEKEEKEEKPRFKDLSEQELDQLQRKKTEASADKQMKWAVRIFKCK